MKRVKAFLIATPILLVVYGLRPIYNPDLSDCKIVQGKIVNIFEGGELDMVFRIEGSDGFYYINRGLETEFDLTESQQKWMGKEAKVWYVDRWLMTKLGNRSFHLARIDVGENTIFDETVSDI